MWDIYFILIAFMTVQDTISIIKMWSKLLNSLVWQLHSATSYSIFEKKKEMMCRDWFHVLNFWMYNTLFVLNEWKLFHVMYNSTLPHPPYKWNLWCALLAIFLLCTLLKYIFYNNLIHNKILCRPCSLKNRQMWIRSIYLILCYPEAQVLEITKFKFIPVQMPDF